MIFLLCRCPPIPVELVSHREANCGDSDDDVDNYDVDNADDNSNDEGDDYDDNAGHFDIDERLMDMVMAMVILMVPRKLMMLILINVPTQYDLSRCIEGHT